jgi:uncharacterized protein (DUF302 family)
MPCKIAIYEENDRVIISTMNMKIMLNALKRTPQLYTEAKTLFGTLITLMKSLS